MLAAVGYSVKRLQRIQIGPLRLGRLRVGEWRYLEPREIKLLNQATSGMDGNSQ
jgi:23S rRNA pseudouridine2605 synthase